MKNIISKKMSTIGLSGIRKMNEKALAMERAGQTVIHFEIGRPDFDTPEYIKKAAYESLERGEVFYTSNLGDMGLREQIAKKLHYQNNIPCRILCCIRNHRRNSSRPKVMKPPQPRWRTPAKLALQSQIAHLHVSCHSSFLWTLTLGVLMICGSF